MAKRQERVGKANWENRTLFHGDNLRFLRNMNSRCVDLIATDPPFNKNKDFHATPNSLARGASFQDRWSWENDVHETWVDQIKDDSPSVWLVIEGSRKSYGDDMGAFLCFIAVRLLEMQRVLKPTGSIYLHCDSTASHYLKKLMDTIFGRNNFRSEIIWNLQTASGYKSKVKGYIRGHDTILYYVKGKKFTFNKEYLPHKEEYLARFKKEDKDGRRYRDDRPGKRRQYLDETEGVGLTDVWSDIMSFQQHSTSKELVGYPTQKPLALYERIIKVSSNKGDIVLDPFCGCATTCVAAERLGRQWVGIDIWNRAHKIVEERLKGEGLEDKNGESNGKLPFGDLHYEKDLPGRTDDGEHAVASMHTVTKRKPFLEEWEKLTHREIREHLIRAQSTGDGLVICAGCGRELEAEFVQLDHINPRSSGGTNDITNRILLCSPCNSKKSDQLTIPGLRNKNKQEDWMKDEPNAKEAYGRAQVKSEEVKKEMEGRAPRLV